MSVFLSSGGAGGASYIVRGEFVGSAAAPKATYDEEEAAARCGEEDTQAHRSVGIGAGRARLPGVRVWRVGVVRAEYS